MTCSDVQRLLPEMFDGDADEALPPAVEIHLQSCLECSDLVSDLRVITTGARELAATDEPSPRVWARIAAELRAEGLIREPEPVAVRPVLVPSKSPRRWNSWWLAPVMASLLVVGSYVVSRRPAQVAKQQAPPAPQSSPAPTPVVTAASPAVRPVTKRTPAAQQVASNATKRNIEPAPSAEDQQFLSVVSTLGPSTRATYESELRAVNADIRETQQYVNQNPDDVDARQHLMDAYQQKALLYQIALDRIQ